MRTGSKLKKGLSALLSLAILATTVPFTSVSAAVKEESGPGLVIDKSYYTLENLTYRADPGCSAITIKGRVTLEIKGTVTLIGGKATDTKGGGAGIHVPPGSTLIITAKSRQGEGAQPTLNAIGGAGQDGESVGIYEEGKWKSSYAGKGGNGAGAGIGGVGASSLNASEEMNCGTVLIQDDFFDEYTLVVNATGGASGRGGRGGRGGKALNYYAYMSVYTSYVVESGAGGGGGGGGGLPGCGIGGGGGKGGDGGKGGSSEVDRNTNGTATAGGSGGGGGGAGYSPGGGGSGGGAGAITGDKFGDDVQESEGTGGGDSLSGSSGSSGSGASVAGQSAAGGKGGSGGETFGGGNGGAGGTGRSDGNDGSAGKPVGASGKGGHVTVERRVRLTAMGGADPVNPANRAPGVGSPDTRTGAEAAGSMELYDPSVVINESFHGTVTDQNDQRLYSVRLRLPQIEPGVLTAEAAASFGTQTFSFTMTGAEAALTLFLREGNYEVTLTAGKEKFPFTVDIQNGNVKVTPGFEYKDPVISRSGGEQTQGIVLTENAQGEKTCAINYFNGTSRVYTYEDNLVFTGYTGPIRVENGNHNITLRDTYIRGEGIGRAVNAIYVNPPSHLTINVEGWNDIDATNARICVPKIGDQEASLTLRGTGHMRIWGASEGAAIGGNGTKRASDPQPPDRDCGKVTINSGSYHITAGVRGHGIGGGIAIHHPNTTTAATNSSGGNITINGGHLTFDQEQNFAPVLAIGGRGNGDGTITMNGGTVISHGMKVREDTLTFNGGSIVYRDANPDRGTEDPRNLRSLGVRIRSKDGKERVYIGGFTPGKEIYMFSPSGTVNEKFCADDQGYIGVPMPVGKSTDYLAVGEDNQTYSGRVTVDEAGNTTFSALEAKQGDGVIDWDDVEDFDEAKVEIMPNGYLYEYVDDPIIGGATRYYHFYQYSGAYRFPSTTQKNLQIVFHAGKIDASFENVSTTRKDKDKDPIITVNPMADVTMRMSGKNEFYTDVSFGDANMPAVRVAGRLTMAGDGSTLFHNKDGSDNWAGYISGQFVLDSGDVKFYGGDGGVFSDDSIVEVKETGEICVNGGNLSFDSGEDAETAFAGKAFVQNGGNVTILYKFTPKQAVINGGTLTVTRNFPENFVSGGGSVYYGSNLLTGATAEGKPVYRAQIPLEDKDIRRVLADNVDMHITSRHPGNAANTLYLYMPETAKLIEVQYTDNSTKYFLLRKESGKTEQTVIPCETPLPKIDLSVSGAEILPIQAGSYTSVVWYNGKAYLGNQDITITGKTDQNTVKVGIENAVLHLDNVSARMKEGSLLQLSEQTTIKLNGDNFLKGGPGAAGIHVPTGCSVTIDTERAGTLEVVGGSGAAGIGGNVQEPGGNVTILGGSVSAFSSAGDAIGSGSVGGDCGDIVIAGGSVRVSTKDGREFGKTPVNQNGEALSRVILSVDKKNPPALAANGSSVKVDGTSYRINAYHPDDHHFYLYVVKGDHTLQIGDQTFDVARLHTSVEGNGSLPVYLDDGTLSDWEMISGRSASGVKAQDGEMLAPGTELLVYPTGNGSSLQKDGIRPGRYIARQTDDGLMLVPVATQGFTDFTGQGWEPVWNGDETELLGWRSESGGMTLSAQADGQSAFRFRWGAQSGTLTGKVFINGQEVLSKELDTDIQEECLFFDGTGVNTIELRFEGKGRAFAFPIAAAELYPVSAVTASFAETVTFTLNQPQEGEAIFLYQDEACTAAATDIDLELPGVQLWKGTVPVFARYQDPTGGNTFDNFSLVFEGGKVETKTDPTISLTPDRDVTIGVKTHLTPYFVVVIPETVALNDEGTASATITASELKNMQTGDSLDVSISGLDGEGQATLTRKDADNTLSVPVTDDGGAPLTNNSLAARFKDNETKPATGGTIYFGAPTGGDRKAGEYEGTITFTIAYQTAGK